MKLKIMFDQMRQRFSIFSTTTDELYCHARFIEINGAQFEEIDGRMWVTGDVVCVKGDSFLGGYGKSTVLIDPENSLAIDGRKGYTTNCVLSVDDSGFITCHCQTEPLLPCPLIQ